MPAVPIPKPPFGRHAATALSHTVLTNAVRTVKTWRNRRRQRICLAKLDARLLSDIGLRPADAERETLKPFWQS